MAEPIEKLLEIMAQLRDPDGGCPWDCKQTFSSIIPHTIEETYEVVDCIERKDYSHLKEELGDLLFQVVFLSRIAEEQGLFDFNGVVNELSDKLVRRHPHVFAGMAINSEIELARLWEKTKQQERDLKKSQAFCAEDEGADESALASVESAHPALTHAVKLQKAAAKTGFDWKTLQGVVDQVMEELGELQAACSEPAQDAGHIEHELGDVLFSCVNLSRHVRVNPETALRRANYRFEQRFRYMETRLGDTGKQLQALTEDEVAHYWQEAKEQRG